MDSLKVYLLWALGVTCVGLVVGLCVWGGLRLSLESPVPMPGWLWVVTWSRVVVQVMCLVATAVLIGMSVSGRFRGWVLGGFLPLATRPRISPLQG